MNTVDKEKRLLMFERPFSLPSKTWVFDLGCGEKAITLSYHNGDPVEVFVRSGKEGSCINTVGAFTGKICSSILRANFDPEMKKFMFDQLVKNLSEMRCDNGVWDNAIYLKSCFHAIAICLQEYLEVNTNSEDVVG